MVFVPLARKPVRLTGTELAVHVKFGEGIFEVRLTKIVDAPEQMVCCILILVILGDGFTFIT